MLNHFGSEINLWIKWINERTSLHRETMQCRWQMGLEKSWKIYITVRMNVHQGSAKEGSDTKGNYYCVLVTMVGSWEWNEKWTRKKIRKVISRYYGEFSAWTRAEHKVIELLDEEECYSLLDRQMICMSGSYKWIILNTHNQIWTKLVSLDSFADINLSELSINHATF